MKKAASLLALVMLSAPVWAGKKEIAPPPLTLEHRHPSGAFTFKTPEGWRVQTLVNGSIEAWGGELGVRFAYQDGEVGYDGLHATCLLDSLAPLQMADPRLRYEYEYMGGLMGDRKVLDSAQLFHYDNAVRGHRDWRQRTVTVVGGGLSLCVMSYAPTAVWKKQAEARATLEAVMGSLTFSK